MANVKRIRLTVLCMIYSYMPFLLQIKLKSRKMSALYHCVVCKHANSTIIDLHNHHIHYHTPEELSHTIINLQGLQTCFKPAVFDNSNNINWYHHFMVKNEKQNIYQHEDDRATTSTILYDEDRKLYHDETYCALNCSPFIIWEHELNKRTEICDEEFFNIVESLCTDLSKTNHRGMKRKHSAYMNSTKVESFVQHNKSRSTTEAGDENRTASTGFPPEIFNPVPSSHQTNYLIANTTEADEILNLQMINDTSIRNNDITRFTFAGIDGKDNVLMYDSLNNTYSWEAIATINFNGKEEHAVYDTN